MSHTQTKTKVEIALLECRDWLFNERNRLSNFEPDAQDNISELDALLGRIDDAKIEIGTKAARKDIRMTVVRAACALSDSAAEFDGDLQYCGEFLDALWTAVDRLKQTEMEPSK